MDTYNFFICKPGWENLQKVLDEELQLLKAAKWGGIHILQEEPLIGYPLSRGHLWTHVHIKQTKQTQREIINNKKRSEVLEWVGRHGKN